MCCRSTLRPRGGLASTAVGGHDLSIMAPLATSREPKASMLDAQREPTTRSSRSYAFAAFASLVIATVGTFACGDDGVAGTTGPNGGADPEPIFRSLEDDLIGTCGGLNGSCHVRGSYQGAPT